MNPALILFGIQAVIRLGKIGKDASEQYARDAEALFPKIRSPEFNRKRFVNGFFGSANYQHFVTGDGAFYSQYWGTHGVVDDLNSVDTLFAAAVKIKSDEGIDLNRWIADSQTIAGASFIAQWDPAKPAPLSPFARIILTAGDIALEYVSINPGLLAAGGNGEKLIGAFAGNLSDLLPNDGEFGDNQQFAQRLLGAFLRAGLETIGREPGWVVSEAHVQKLISAAVNPIVASLPGDITQQLKYREVTDALIGPAASAAMQTLAEHPDAFFGADFRPTTAIGALTQAMLAQAAAAGLDDQFTQKGIIELYKAALGVAAEKPHLFVDDHGTFQDQLAKDLIANFATVLVQAVPPFDGGVGVQLASAALSAIGANAHRFAGADKPWEQTAADLVDMLTGRLSTAFEANAGMQAVFSKAQLIEIGRIILGHVAATPEMIIDQKTAMAQLVGTIAGAMAADDHLLLDGDDWVEIVKVAADEAAANPARLFKLDPNDPDETLAAKIIQTLLRPAGAILDRQDLKEKSILFGRTLREAIIVVLHATSGNEEAARMNLTSIELLVAGLNEFVAGNSDRYGSKEWLCLFRQLLTSVLEGRELEQLTVESADLLLEGKM